ncbi:MAG TPA: CPBP family intramembrane glutamic endopeptidase [Allosphingosinicella sp.]
MTDTVTGFTTHIYTVNIGDGQMEGEKASRLQAVGSARHTAILVGILLVVACAGFLALQRAGPAQAGGGSVGLYLGLLAAEWGLFYYVRLGVRGRGGSVRDLVSARPLKAKALAIDAFLALALLAALIGADFLLSKLLGTGNGALVRTLLVRRASLIPVWILLAVSAGFVEEVTFRGYLQRQFGAWLGSPWLGIILQAMLFGVTHGYQGGVLIFKITMLGLLFGAAAQLRRSLLPGIAAHAGLDIIGGIAALH